MADPAESLAADAEGDAALALGREPHPGEGLLDVRGTVDARDDEPAGPEVERARDPQAVAPLDADEAGRPGVPDRVELGQDAGLGAHPVLGIDDEPVEAGLAGDLRHDRRTGRQPGSEGGLAAEDAVAQGGHGVNDARPGPVGGPTGLRGLRPVEG